MMTRTGSGCSLSIWRAWMTICRSMSWSRGRSRSTPRGGRARTAPGWAPGWRSTPSWSCPDPDKTLAEGAIGPWSGGHVSDYFFRLIEALGQTLGFGMDTPWARLPGRGPGGPAERLRPAGARARTAPPGAGNGPTTPRSRARSRIIERRHSEAEIRLQPGAVRGLHARGALPVLPGNPAQAHRPGGDRGRPAHRRDLRAAHQRAGHAAAAPGPVRDRTCRSPRPSWPRSAPGWRSCWTWAWTTCPWTGPSPTLAGGEAQRIRLATQIGSGLVGVLYVLDEPSIGLHQRDNHRLLETLIRLRDLGNTLIVVEHDEDTIRAADWVVDIGPGAGEHGGRSWSSGPVERLAGQSGVADRGVPDRAAADPGAGGPAQAVEVPGGRGQGGQ